MKQQLYFRRLPWYFNDSFETNLGASGDNIEPGGRELIDGLKENIFLK